MKICSIFMSGADTNLHKNPKGGESVDVFPCSSVEPPQPLCAARPSSMEACTVQEMSQTFTSISRSQDSLKTTTTVHTEPGADGKDTLKVTDTVYDSYMIWIYVTHTHK